MACMHYVGLTRSRLQFKTKVQYSVRVRVIVRVRQEMYCTGEASQKIVFLFQF